MVKEETEGKKKTILQLKRGKFGHCYFNEAMKIKF